MTSGGREKKFYFSLFFISTFSLLSRSLFPGQFVDINSPFLFIFTSTILLSEVIIFKIVCFGKFQTQCSVTQPFCRATPLVICIIFGGAPRRKNRSTYKSIKEVTCGIPGTISRYPVEKQCFSKLFSSPKAQT